MKIFFGIIVATLLQGCSVFGVRTVEILNYQVLQEDGKFDIRQYEDYWVARTKIDGAYRSSSDEGFRLLFNYISGGNKQQEKIAMTGPVMQQQEGEKIAMTGPVIQHKSGKSWIMEFVLPAKYNELQPPEPLNPAVSVVKVPGYRTAALRYSGNLREEKYNRKVKELLYIVQLKGLQAVGEPFSAGYDPPWTIPFLKRNEVLIVVE